LQTIRLTTLIDAPVQRCFLLSLSVDLHILTAGVSGKRAIAGVTSGLLRAGQSVTWSGRHFGLRLRHTSLVDVVRPYNYFRDVMTHGHFASFEHEHHFAPMDDGTRMRDVLRFTPPFGLFGRLMRNRLQKHLRNFLLERNTTLKRVAESEEWHQYLDSQPPLNLTPAAPVTPKAKTPKATRAR